MTKTIHWIQCLMPENGILNVAGSRRSKAPGKRVMRDVLSNLEFTITPKG